ncbi:hypothetical protein ACFWCH_09755 [Microbacterium sp. NPDC060132]|uniref:hypothetical protein n=1 Tax=unclassified Microbacterium TaxID=2609290 RepID=UPI00365F17F9
MTPLVPVNVDVTTSMVAVVTVLTAIVIGLATLARPTRATIVWGVAFGIGMLGAYLWLAGHHTGLPVLRAASSALTVVFIPLVWIGVRIHFGRSAPWLPVIVALIGVPVALVSTAGTAWYLLVFHLVFLSMGVFAGLLAWELLRGQPPARDVVMPLALAACGFAIVSVVSGASALVSGSVSTEAQLSALRGMNAVGAIVVSTCAAFTLVLLVRVESAARGDVGAADRARARLRKAEAQNDGAWSVLDVRLDDPADLREASSSGAFRRIVDRFHADVQEALPTTADAERVSDDRVVVLIRGSDEAVRFHLRAILSRISVIDPDAPVSGIRSSASIGWATSSVAGYDYDALLAAAAAAADRARAAGGDQWKRAVSADLSPV